MTLLTLVVPAACSLVLCLLLTPLLRNLAVRLDWVDRPDLDRKLHQIAVPRIGGVPVVLACLISVTVFVFLAAQSQLVLTHTGSLALQVLPASFLIFLTGVLDDLLGLRPVQKLGGQVLAAVFAALSGIRFHFWDGYFWGDVAGAAVTIVWLVACSNAFNLIDGIDGLATGLGLIATMTMLFVALLEGNTGLAVLSAAMTGALLGFLYFNFNPASIFLGDSGSLWTGFMLGCFSLLWSNKMETFSSMVAPAVALAIPLTDTMVSITRRYVSATPIFGGDHNHIHHRLLDRRLGPRGVALCLYGVAVVASGFAIALSKTSGVTAVIIAGLFCVSVGLAIRSLVYEEFRVLADVMRGVRSSVKDRLCLARFESQLREAATPEACWCVVRKMCRDFGFSSVSLRIGGYSFSDQFILSRSEVWVLRIPLSESDDVSLTHRLVFRTASDSLARLADVLQRTLTEKSAAFIYAEQSEGAYLEQGDGTFGGAPRTNAYLRRRGL